LNGKDESKFADSLLTYVTGLNTAFLLFTLLVRIIDQRQQERNKEIERMNKRVAAIIICLILTANQFVLGQNVVIVVIDGARYSEAFGAKNSYMPRIWNELCPLGTKWTNFRNNGITSTGPGHASIITGTWQRISNKGIEHPTKPTIFEYYRKATGYSEQSVAIVAGKTKLDFLAYSTSAEYGADYKASFSIGEDDKSIVNILKQVLVRNHPRITLVNLPDVDDAGHSGNRKKYISSLRTADSLVYVIWQMLQADSVYHGKTTLFVTNDHGRHDDSHGGFRKHGDTCEGCRHIMLLAIGRGFPAERSVARERTQCDIAPTIGKLLSFPTEYTEGTSLLDDTTSNE
jgi:membrane-anchored protein YejM (alkaline phosphatase superfamily)